MTRSLALALPLLLTALPALAEGLAPSPAGDAAKGEDLFKKCRACHAITAPDGTAIQKGGRTGPNLYGVMTRGIAGDPDFAYGPSITALAATGRQWDAASLAAYLSDPARWLQAELGDSGARSKMSFKLGAGGTDIAAYLATTGG